MVTPVFYLARILFVNHSAVVQAVFHATTGNTMKNKLNGNAQEIKSNKRVIIFNTPYLGGIQILAIDP